MTAFVQYVIGSWWLLLGLSRVFKFRVSCPCSISILLSPNPLYVLAVWQASPKAKTPEPEPQAKYHSQLEFMRKSGWFSPTLETVLCKKMNTQLSAVSRFPGVYYFVHRETRNKGFTAKSKNAFYDIVQMFHQLYDKPYDKLSPIERELKYINPDAKGWVIRLLTVPDAESLDFNEAWSIVNHRSLHPEGLNPKLTFHSKEHFYEFAEKYRAKKIKEKQKQ